MRCFFGFISQNCKGNVFSHNQQPDVNCWRQPWRRRWQEVVGGSWCVFYWPIGWTNLFQCDFNCFSYLMETQQLWNCFPPPTLAEYWLRFVNICNGNSTIDCEFSVEVPQQTSKCCENPLSAAELYFSWNWRQVGAQEDRILKPEQYIFGCFLLEGISFHSFFFVWCFRNCWEAWTSPWSSCRSSSSVSASAWQSWATRLSTTGGKYEQNSQVYYNRNCCLKLWNC